MQTLSTSIHRTALLILVLAGTATYFNSFQGVFVFDDALLWQREAELQEPLKLFEYPRPIGMLSFAANYHLNRSIGNHSGFQSFSFHLVNLMIHLSAALALFGILRRTFVQPVVSPRFQKQAGTLAFAITLLWLLHPLHTGSVTYIIQRFESLMGAFFLLAVYALIRGAEAKESVVSRRIWLLVSVIAAVLSLGTKEVILGGPILLLCFDRALLARSWRELWQQRRFYYVALGTTYLLFLHRVLFDIMLRLMPQLLVVDAGEIDLKQPGSAVEVQGLTPLTYLISQPGVILHYLRLSFWPIGQCLDYGWQVASSLGEVLLPGLTIVALLGITAWGICKQKPWAILGILFFGVLAPTSSILPIRDLAFEHRMYLPLIAVITTAVLVVYTLIDCIFLRLKPSKYHPSRSGILLLFLLAIPALFLAERTVSRNQLYHAETLIWAETAKQRPNHRRAQFNYAESLVGAAQKLPDEQRATAHKQYRLACIYYEKALAINPRHIPSYLQLGKTYYILGEEESAAEQFYRVLELDPQNSMARAQLETLEIYPVRLNKSPRVDY